MKIRFSFSRLNDPEDIFTHCIEQTLKFQSFQQPKLEAL